eukprot:2122166-Pyramimonas_sp.AAC.1
MDSAEEAESKWDSLCKLAHLTMQFEKQLAITSERVGWEQNDSSAAEPPRDANDEATRHQC